MFNGNLTLFLFINMLIFAIRFIMGKPRSTRKQGTSAEAFQSSTGEVAPEIFGELSVACASSLWSLPSTSFREVMDFAPNPSVSVISASDFSQFGLVPAIGTSMRPCVPNRPPNVMTVEAVGFAHFARETPAVEFNLCSEENTHSIVVNRLESQVNIFHQIYNQSRKESTMIARVLATMSLCTMLGWYGLAAQPRNTNFTELSIESNFQLQMVPSVEGAGNVKITPGDTTQKLVVLTLVGKVTDRALIILSDLDVIIGSDKLRFRAFGISFDTEYSRNDNPANANFIGKIFESGSLVQARLVFTIPNNVNIKDLSVCLLRSLPGEIQERGTPTDRNPLPAPKVNK